MTTEDITRRIEESLGQPGLVDMLAEHLSASDLQSLLLAIYRKRSARRTHADVLRDYERNRFTSPSTVNTNEIQRVEQELRKRLPQGATTLELSPVCPLGTSSALAGVSQDWSVPTARGTEVVSDATNVLALECALRRRQALKGDPKSVEVFHYCCSHRLLRPQFSDDPNMLSHFRLFHSCSAGRDSGGLQFEADAIADHVSNYLSVAQSFAPEDTGLEFVLTDFHQQNRDEHLQRSILTQLRSAFPKITVTIDNNRKAGRGYYRDLCFHINAHLPGRGMLQLADGGSVDWTQKLLGNAKERLVISAISLERLCALAA